MYCNATHVICMNTAMGRTRKHGEKKAEFFRKDLRPEVQVWPAACGTRTTGCTSLV